MVGAVDFHKPKINILQLELLNLIYLNFSNFQIFQKVSKLPFKGQIFSGVSYFRYKMSKINILHGCYFSQI